MLVCLHIANILYAFYTKRFIPHLSNGHFRQQSMSGGGREVDEFVAVDGHGLHGADLPNQLHFLLHLTLSLRREIRDHYITDSMRTNIDHV